MRRLFRLILYLGSLTCLLLMAASSAFGQCGFTNLNSSYCVDAPSFTLTGGTNYYINSTNTSTFNPATLGVGTHRVITTNGDADAYNVNTTGTFSPEPPVSATTVALGDDAQSGAIAIGFNFNFFGNDQTVVRIGSNGVLGFGTTGPYPSVAPVNEPLSDGGDPYHLIAFAWEDLKPNSGGTIRHFMTGSAPFRKFVVDFINVPQSGAGGNVTVQVQLHETTNVVEIHSTNVTFSDRSGTQGVESAAVSGFTLSYPVSGRND